MNEPLRVGIIGASARGGWAKESHVPAVQGLAGLELVAVATRSRKSADAAAEAFRVRGYDNANELIHDPGIDLVTVAVKVPDHHALVLGALAAGKHVFCEWPLGRDADEAAELRDAADEAYADAGAHAAIGVQARTSPAVRRARELVESGTIGRVLSARHYSGTIAFGRKIGAADAYLEEEANGATLVTIHGGHALDLSAAVLGGFEDVTAFATTQYPEIVVGDDGELRARMIPDHLLALSRLRGGAALSVEVAGGRPADDVPFQLEIVGEEGTLALRGGAPRGFQSGRISLSLNGESQLLDEDETAPMPDAAANVAGAYAALRDDIVAGDAFSAPGFDHAVRLSRLIEEATASSDTGTREPVEDSPAN